MSNFESGAEELENDESSSEPIEVSYTYPGHDGQCGFLAYSVYELRIFVRWLGRATMA